MNIEKDSIDQLFRDNLQGVSPEVPVDVMENVLNQWQQMSSLSPATSANSTSMKVSQSANGWKLVKTLQNLTILPKVALGIGGVSLAVGLVAIWINSTVSNSVLDNPKKFQESPKNGASAVNNLEQGANSASEMERVGDSNKKPMGLSNADESIINSAIKNPIIGKIENTPLSKTEVDGLKSSTSISTVSSNTTKVAVEQNAINKKKEGVELKNILADLNVAVLEDGWVQVLIDQPVTEKTVLDWGDGKFEKIKGGKIYRHQYLPWSKKRFTLQLVEFKDADMKVKSVFAQGFAIVSPDQQEEIIPEIITPNGDGYNDEFYVKIPSPEYFELLVFDKNNSVVFRSNSVEDRWNALAKNQQVMEGEYKILLTLKYSGEASHRFIRKRLIVQQ